MDAISAGQPPTEATVQSTDHPTVFGIAACAVPVAAFSSYTLFTTAHGAGVPIQLAWVLPVATDLAALVATRVWLSPRYPKSIQRYAASIAMAAMTLSFVGASLHYAVDGATPAWLRIAVGGLPSLSLAAIVHLGALIVADRAGKRARKSVSAPEVVTATPTVTPDTSGVLASPVEVGEPARIPDVPIPRSEAEPSERNNVVVLGEGRSARRHQMLAYLDENPDATGAELDRVFDTKDYGRTIRRDWTRRQQKVSGE